MLPDLDGYPFQLEAGPRAIYWQISDWMRENIMSETWPAHFKLPAEADLAHSLNVSRGTLKSALSTLVQEGLLVQIHGKGTYVAEKKRSHPFGQELISFAESMERQGVPFQTIVMAQRLETTKPFVQRMLGLATETQVFYLQRVRLIGNEPAILLQNYVHATLCPGIEREDYTTTSLFKQIEQCSGHRIAGGERRFEARLVDSEVCDYLSLPIGFPILFFQQVAQLDNGAAVEASNIWLRTDRCDMVSRIER